MQGQLAQPLDVMAVVTSKDKKTVEALDVDQVFVVHYAINHVAKHAQFVVGFGGKDSSGKLHLFPELREKLSQITIGGDDFVKWFETAEGNPKRELTQAFLDQIFAEVILPACQKLAWGMEEIDVHLNGKSCFKVEKPKAKPAA